MPRMLDRHESVAVNKAMTAFSQYQWSQQKRKQDNANA